MGASAVALSSETSQFMVRQMLDVGRIADRGQYGTDAEARAACREISLRAEAALMSLLEVLAAR